jgi:hypothetical protein
MMVLGGGGRAEKEVAVTEKASQLKKMRCKFF